MRLAFTMMLVLAANSGSHAQAGGCNCPPNEYAESNPQKVFELTDSKKIVLCGWAKTSDQETIYSEFILAECGQNAIIDFWDATAYCRVNAVGDVLSVDELTNLPVGDYLEFRRIIWKTEEIRFKAGALHRRTFVNKKIRKYTKHEIETILREYEITGGSINDDKMSIAYKLFVATLSGDKKSRQCFNEFKSKFGPLDGAFLETYKELTAMLRAWDKG